MPDQRVNIDIDLKSAQLQQQTELGNDEFRNKLIQQQRQKDICYYTTIQSQQGPFFHRNQSPRRNM